MSSKPKILLIGTFDGVHLGHQALLKRGEEEARRLNADLVVLTFKTPPSWFFAPDSKKPLIMTLEERTEKLKRWGADEIIPIDFTEEIANLTALEFLQQFPVRKLILGHDAKIGRDGTHENIERAAKSLGIEVEFLPPYKMDGEVISSTSIRALLERGDQDKADKFLGNI